MSQEGVIGGPPPPHPLQTTPIHRLKRVAWVVVPGVALALAAVMLVPAALGYHRYVITGDSMSGTIDRGSVVFDDEVPVSELAKGDVITYDPPASAGIEGPVTHRIHQIRTTNKGERKFRTVGDANEAPDPWTFTLDQPTQARVSFHVPYIGFVFAALSIRLVRMLLIGLPALLIAVMLVRRMWREAGEELARRQAAGGLAAPAAAIPVPATSVTAPAPAAAVATPPAPLPAPAVPAATAPEPPRPAPATTPGLPRDAFAPSPGLLVDLRRDVERLRESSNTMMEGLVRLRGRLEGVELA